MKKLWVRIGAEITLTEEEFEKGIKDNKKLEEIVEDKVTNGQYELSGETYAPDIDDERYINGQIEAGIELLL